MDNKKNISDLSRDKVSFIRKTNLENQRVLTENPGLNATNYSLSKLTSPRSYGYRRNTRFINCKKELAGIQLVKNEERESNGMTKENYYCAIGNKIMPLPNNYTIRTGFGKLDILVEYPDIDSILIKNSKGEPDRDATFNSIIQSIMPKELQKKLIEMVDAKTEEVKNGTFDKKIKMLNIEGRDTKRLETERDYFKTIGVIKKINKQIQSTETKISTPEL